MILILFISKTFLKRPNKWNFFKSFVFGIFLCISFSIKMCKDYYIGHHIYTESLVLIAIMPETHVFNQEMTLMLV